MFAPYTLSYKKGSYCEFCSKVKQTERPKNLISWNLQNRLDIKVGDNNFGVLVNGTTNYNGMLGQLQRNV